MNVRILIDFDKFFLIETNLELGAVAELAAAAAKAEEAEAEAEKWLGFLGFFLKCRPRQSRGFFVNFLMIDSKKLKNFDD